MTAPEAAFVVLAAIGAGALNAVVGAGTLVTFPTLLAIGIPPVIANVSNTVGLVTGSVAGAHGYRHTLKGHGRLVARLVVASTIGGVTGASLLLLLPSRAFEFIIPVLLVVSAILAAVQPRVSAAVARRHTPEARDVRTAVAVPSTPATVGEIPAAARSEPAPVVVSPVLFLSVALAGVYGGYFGAAQGVILLAVLGMFVAGDMNDVNGIKNVLAGVANLVASVVFIAVADIRWDLSLLVAIGSTFGGWVGARYGRRLPSGALRALVVIVAVTAAIWQLTR